MNAVKIHYDDNVVVALVKIDSSSELRIGEHNIRAVQDIPEGHKIAMKDIRTGDPVIKSGEVIGCAGKDIKAGSWVHLHNLQSIADQRKTYKYQFDAEKTVMPVSQTSSVFRGYERQNREAGTRNYIAILSGTFCANSHIQQFASMARKRFPETEYFDGFLPLTHECGCGQAGDDLETACKIVANLISSPNFGGVLFVEIGCETSPFKKIKQYLQTYAPDRLAVMRMQDEDDEYACAMDLLGKLYEKVNRDRRKPCNMSKLHIALHCGGSDAFSGITGNRVIGAFAELFTQRGGTVSLTEVTEMFGTEQTLMNRAVDQDVYAKVVNLIENQRKYLEKYGASANANPSIGNKEGGITTIEEKSVGCVQKGGRCAVMDVVEYGSRVSSPGLNLVYGTGNDIVGVTAQIAAGANLVLFSTGRGTPIAFVAPTLKVASNNRIFQKKQTWMDFNAGVLLGGADMNQLANDLYRLVLDTAEGNNKASNELMEIYQIGIFRDGVIL